MNYTEVLENARKILAPRCKVCPVCNGRACVGQVPGPGGKGTGSTFHRNREYLEEHVKLNLHVLGEFSGRDTSVQLLGKTFSLPVFAAPIGLVALNWSDALDEDSYAEIIVEGMKQAGSAAFTGGGTMDKCFFEPLEVIRSHEGWGIPTLKPWAMELAKERVKMAEAANALAFAMDIDSAGLPHSGASKQPMYFKSQEDLRTLAHMTEIPFIVKGIMTPAAAVQAAEAGVYGIVVSNHGGRVLDNGLAAAEVLPDIRKAVGDSVKIFADGGVRTGVDVFKMLALGADAVLIGRPYSVVAYGGGVEGVRLYTEKLVTELKDTMAMTGCSCLQEIDFSKIQIV